MISDARGPIYTDKQTLLKYCKPWDGTTTYHNGREAITLRLSEPINNLYIDWRYSNDVWGLDENDIPYRWAERWRLDYKIRKQNEEYTERLNRERKAKEREKQKETNAVFGKSSASARIAKQLNQQNQFDVKKAQTFLDSLASSFEKIKREGN